MYYTPHYSVKIVLIILNLVVIFILSIPNSRHGDYKLCINYTHAKYAVLVFTFLSNRSQKYAKGIVYHLNYFRLKDRILQQKFEQTKKKNLYRSEFPFPSQHRFKSFS